MNIPSLKKIKKSGGFTLLELMIVCGIVVVVLVGLLATYVACFELAETTRNTHMALVETKAVLENMRGIAFTSVYGTYNGHVFQVPQMAANQSLGYVVINNSNASLLRVDAGVCWKQKNDRIIGECQESSGALVFSDANGNGILDSPVQVTTLMSQR
ncbi:MAG: prepilin-type N-terminal cleavage/methylation domain-containing protein [Candidatus Omnitrophota bacterium]